MSLGLGLIWVALDCGRQALEFYVIFGLVPSSSQTSQPVRPVKAANQPGKPTMRHPNPNHASFMLARANKFAYSFGRRVGQRRRSSLIAGDQAKPSQRPTKANQMKPNAANLSGEILLWTSNPIGRHNEIQFCFGFFSYYFAGL